jgi:hypothetical protein
MFITSTGFELHRQMTGTHKPRTPQNLQGTKDNYLVLSSIGFNKASVSTLMAASGINYMTCKGKINEKLTWFDYNKHF